ncbi:MAG: type II secretion system F family protein [Beutenbergiaceae bacterium]
MSALMLGLLALVAALPWVSRRRLGHRPDVRVRVRPQPQMVDEAIVLDLIRAALATGVDLLTALDAVAQALPQTQGRSYERAVRTLRLGGAWEDAWADHGRVPQALVAAWRDGIDPDPLLQFAAASIRRSRSAVARAAAAKLGVRLVLPLGLCFLPSFVLLGLVPVMLSAASSIWSTG